MGTQTRLDPVIASFQMKLKQAANGLGAKAYPAPLSRNDSIWEIVYKFNPEVTIEVQFNHRAHTATINCGRDIRNLSLANLQRHISAALRKQQKNLKEAVEERAKQQAEEQAGQKMVAALNPILVAMEFGNYNKGWKHRRGTLRLCRIFSERSGDCYEFGYQFEYAFKGVADSDTRLQGSFKANNISQIVRAITTLFSV